jgi:UDP-N-acetylmuramoyl-L-alanyl-D-glutamate--2,6-diaminopimelate ligase
MKLKLENIFAQHKVKGITFNSQNVQAGDAFFAIKGENFDGNNYIDDALSRGAAVAITDDIARQQGERVIYVEDARVALAIASGMIYSKLPKNIVAVTGTNGKSSVVSYVQQILNLLGKTSAAMGTLGIESSQKLPSGYLNKKSNLTTSDPISFRKNLQMLAENGIDHVAFEASSHGLCQKRLGDLKVQSAAFTSFSQDHLEYHKTMENYLQAKLQLFSEHLLPGGEAVINSEIAYFNVIKKFLEDKGIRYSTVENVNNNRHCEEPKATWQSSDYGSPRQSEDCLAMTDGGSAVTICTQENSNSIMQITKSKQSLSGQEITFEFKGNIYSFNTDIIGSFQAINILIATKLVHNLGINIAKIVTVLSKVRAVTGRLQRITNVDDEFQVFVDYAHTPDALEKSLEELRMLKGASGKLYVVFGCGGDRDTTKRPIMGKIATKIADKVIITDDNPRSENAGKIRREIIAGASGAEEIGDRRRAIIDTIAQLRKNDILLIAGKGHEDYQIIGDQVVNFSDIEIAKNSLWQ